MNNFNMYATFDLQLEFFLDFSVYVQNYFWHLWLELYIFLYLSLWVGHICLVLHWILIFVFFIPYTRSRERKLEAWIQYNTPNYPILGQWPMWEVYEVMPRCGMQTDINLWCSLQTPPGKIIPNRNPNILWQVIWWWWLALQCNLHYWVLP